MAPAAHSRTKLPWILVAVTLAACSTDPTQRKITYLNDGMRSFHAGKYQEAVIQFRNAIQIDPGYAAAHYQLARTYQSLANTEQAYRELTETVALDPANTDAQLDLAHLMTGRRQFQQAQSIALKVLAANPGNARAHAILGESYTAAHDLTNAIAEIRKTVEIDPKRAESYVALGSVYFAAGRLTEAEDAYRKAAMADPKSVPARMALSEFYFAGRRTAEAETEMRAACDLDAHAVAPRLFLGRILVAANRLADAEKVYSHLKTVAPDNPQAYQALALFYSTTNQKDKALTELQSLASARPKDVSVKASLVETLLDLGRIDEAASLARTALKEHPADSRLLLSSGRILIGEGKAPEAINTLQSLTKADPTSAAGFYFLGVAQKASGFSTTARSSFSRALELSPRMSQAAAAIASLDLERGDHDQAMRQSDRAVETNPDLASGYVTRARAMIAQGNLREGEMVLRDALKRDPVSLPALATLLNIAASQGRTAEAVQQISGLLKQHPENAGLHFLQALGEFTLGDLDRSEAGVRQALAIDAKTPDAYTLLANIDFARGSIEKGKADLRAAIAANPRKSANYVALGTQFEKENNWEEARKLFEKAHEADASAPLICAELAFLYLEHGGDVNVAVSLAQTAKRTMPESPITSDALGWAYYKLGSTDLAINELKESARKVPDNAVYQYHLGMAYMTAHRFEAAAGYLQRALRNGPHFLYAEDARAALRKMARAGGASGPVL